MTQKVPKYQVSQAAKDDDPWYAEIMEQLNLCDLWVLAGEDSDIVYNLILHIVEQCLDNAFTPETIATAHQLFFEKYWDPRISSFEEVEHFYVPQDYFVFPSPKACKEHIDLMKKNSHKKVSQ